MASKLWELVLHEVGHAVCAVLNNATERAGPLSVEPGNGYDGICFVGYPPGWRSYVPSGRAWSKQDDRTRLWVEIEVQGFLAGEAALDAWSHLREPARAAVPVQAAVAPAALELPEREAAMLSNAAASTTVLGDWGRALSLLCRVHGEDESVARSHLDFLRAEVLRLLRDERSVRMGAALAGKLMIQRTMPAELWLRTLAAVP